MRYLALASDYDGTLATDGKVDRETIDALRRLKDSGRKLILVTGRDLEELEQAFPDLPLFDLAVVENGALLYDPTLKKETRLAPKADARLVDELRKRKVKPLSVGRSIIATREPHETEVVAAIRDLGLELQVIFNKGAVMVLPAGTNKESGLEHALRSLGLSSKNVVSVGDAENDHALLAASGFSVAVANAVPSLQEEADWVTKASEGAGVTELIERMLEDDLGSLERNSKRHRLAIGEDDRGRKVRINPLTSCLLIAGPSGSGKTRATTSILERVAKKGFQLCIIDPEGDYDQFPDAVKLGDPDRPPLLDEIVQLLERFENPVINLLGIKLDDRPRFFASLLGRIQELRASTGRPHFVVLDEAHHLIPAEWKPAPLTFPTMFEGTAMITVHPESVSEQALSKVTQLIVVGEEPQETIDRFCEAVDTKAPQAPKSGKKKRDVIFWSRGEAQAIRVRLRQATVDHDRHQRKYARGDMEEDAFYFRGPDRRLNLRAHNLVLFCQIAEGVDDETWLYHLERGDYSKWIRDAVQDDGLADRIGKIEAKGFNPAESRKRIIEEISKAYTAAA